MVLEVLNLRLYNSSTKMGDLMNIIAKHYIKAQYFVSSNDHHLVSRFYLNYIPGIPIQDPFMKRIRKACTIL